jgi:hypothetical protein
MKYALLIYSHDGVPSSPEITAEYMAIAELPGAVGGAQLQPAMTATTVRVENGGSITTDGPFTETKEVLAGFYLFEADDLDTALDVAARVPAARFGGAVEVRPLVER